MATGTATATTKVENPKKTLPEPQLSDSTTPTNQKEEGKPIGATDSASNPSAASPVNKDSGEKNSGDTEEGTGGGPVTDTEKKMRRAERFGVPVQLSEKEKRDSRAERFGTAVGSHGSEALKKSEELKRKARAERFGVPQSTTSDENAKKKARLARFAPASKPDAEEEDKRKARALRFAKPASVTKQNGKENSESKVDESGLMGKGT